jgi:ComF family protein
MDALRTVASHIVDAFVPARCAGCGAIAREPICAPCRERLLALPAPPDSRRDGGSWTAAFVYEEPLRAIIHRAKYRGERAALHALVTMAVDRITQRQRLRGDGIVTVPLGRRRRRQRGYNQAEVVAVAIAARCDLRLLTGLVRVRETRPQAERHAAARRVNLAGAFAWRGAALNGARVWLADDVITTGATASEAAGALRGAGASQVNVVALAAVP